MALPILDRFYYEHSAFKYTWTSREGDLFNNRYYKNIVADGTDEYFIEGYDKNECIRIGDADGKIGDVKWVPSFNGFTKVLHPELTKNQTIRPYVDESKSPGGPFELFRAMGAS